MSQRGLQRRYVGGKWRKLGHGVGEFIKRQTVSWPHEFLNEARGGLALKFEVFYFTQTRIDHQGEVQRLLRFRLEDFYLLFDAFFIDFELVLREAERGTAVFVQHAGKGADQIDLGADAAALVLFRALPCIDARLCCGCNQQQSPGEYARKARAEHQRDAPFPLAHSEPLEVWC